MFERYTEKARRVIFFARYEATGAGSAYIETEFLLLGLLREDRPLVDRFTREPGTVEWVREQIKARHVHSEKVAGGIDLPLSNEGKRVLAYAAEEADQLRSRPIGAEHILLGLLREFKCFAAQMLHKRGVRIEQVREDLENRKGGPMAKLAAATDRDAGVYARAKERGQKTFTLVEQDPTTVETICFWIGKNVHTAPPEKLHDALQSAIEMRNFSKLKLAD